MQIDEFESQFNRSSREPFKYEDPAFRKVLVVTDEAPEKAQALIGACKRLMSSMEPDGLDWHAYSAQDFNSVRELLGKIESLKPDLVVVERHLKTKPEDRMFGLNNYVDALTFSAIPTLLLPEVQVEELGKYIREPKEVMVNTNRLVGNNKLVNWALKFSADNSKVFLTHIEDDRIFDRYLEAIAKIPEIDTNLARDTLRETLLKLPVDFAAEVKRVIKERVPRRLVHSIVQFGHSVRDHIILIEEHEIDLLVINTEDHHVRTMSDIAYALTVECRQIPILLLSQRQ